MPRLIAQLSDPDADPDQRRVAAERLGQSRDRRAVNPLITALGEDADAGVRKNAATALGKLGKHGKKRIFEALIKALKDDPDDEVRQAAEEALRRLCGH